METKEIRAKIYSKIDELPTLPAVLPKILSLIESNRSDASDVADAISSDPAMTSKILKAANSAYYGFSQNVASISKAVPLLGFNMVRSLALSIGVIRNLPSDKKAPHFSQEGLWTHSLAVATVMQEFGNKFGEGKVNEYFFVIGLLHDIGKIVLNQFFNDLFQQALEEVNNRENTKLYMAEHRMIGLDHGEVGAMLLARWKFPTAIINPIAVHHQTEIPEGTNANDVALLRIANALSQELSLGEEGNPVPPEIPEIEIKTLGIRENDVDDMRVFLHGVEDGIHAFFSAIN